MRCGRRISTFKRVTWFADSIRMSCIAVIDFETTGLSPAVGDRATDVAIVLLEAGRVVDRFQSRRFEPMDIEPLQPITEPVVMQLRQAARV